MRAIVGVAVAVLAMVASSSVAGAQDADSDYAAALQVYVERPSMRYCDDNAVSVEGFLPNSLVTFTITDPAGNVVELGSVTTDAEGRASLPFQLSAASAGDVFVITATGTDLGGEPATISSEVTVVAGECTDDPGPDPSDPGEDDLYRTGTDLSGVLRIALVALAAGAALLLAARKRQAHTA
ncbi:MAG: hypothetical protein GXY13_08255 [Acidimicrobiales bacterium]|nr:hypothetical protein [Acidimicrobiales bacterium]